MAAAATYVVAAAQDYLRAVEFIFGQVATVRMRAQCSTRIEFNR